MTAFDIYAFVAPFLGVALMVTTGWLATRQWKPMHWHAKTQASVELPVRQRIYPSDRASHWKVVMVALAAAMIVIGVAIAARDGDPGATITQRVIKAGKAVLESALGSTPKI